MGDNRFAIISNTGSILCDHPHRVKNYGLGLFLGTVTLKQHTLG